VVKRKGIGKGTPGPGRPPGSQNRLTKSAKEAFAQAFDDMGGTAGLVAWGRKNPDDFYKLYAKLIPIDITSGGERLIPPSINLAG
jgi:hypothetical protein